MVRFSNDSFALSLAYINWETDAIVGIELIRNIGIALGNDTFYSLSIPSLKSKPNASGLSLKSHGPLVLSV